ncbi:MAG TPA: hypothetical protein DCP91_01695 [Eggerthellaceae bacterium]|nr:hypothetical protein [Eggerthellaceae bacterium]
MAASERGMSDDDYFGTADNPRNGKLEEAGPDAQGIPETPGHGGEIAQVGGGDDERPSIEEKVRDFVDSLSPEEREYLSETIPEGSQLALVTRSWEGLLPAPESFNQYSGKAQDHIIAWNDAQILDESKRLDKLTDAAISSSKASLYTSFVINLVFAVLSFVAFAATDGNPASFGFLAVPGVSVIFNIWRSRKDDGREYEDREG